MAVARTVVSTPLIDRVAARLQRRLHGVPVAFEWFAPGSLDGSLGAGGGERAGAAFVRHDAAALDREPTAQLGQPFADRVQASAIVRQTKRLAALQPQAINATEQAGEPITGVLSQARGNAAPIGGIKVVTNSGWYAAQPSDSADIYTIYAESLARPVHLQRIPVQAQATVETALKSTQESP